MRYYHGEYIMFVDSDDAITKDALKDFYTAAKEFGADVVHCEKFFGMRGDVMTTDLDKLDVMAIKNTNFVTKPAFLSEKMVDRVKLFNSNTFDWSTYTNFVRRDLIARHNLQFPDFKVCEDAVFTIYLLCFAEKFLLTPTVHYVYRYRKDSACRGDSLPTEEIMKRWGDFFFRGITMLDKFFDTLPFFIDYPEYKYQIFDLLVTANSGPMLNSYGKTPLFYIEKYARAELEKVGDKMPIALFLFNRMNIYNRMYNHARQSVSQIKEIINKI